MRKNYVKPILNSEEFVTQEYVAACYLLPCIVKGNDGGEDGIGKDGNPHNETGCNRQEAQVIKEKDGYIDTIYEIPHSWFRGGYADNIEVGGNSNYKSIKLKDIYEQNLLVTWETTGSFGEGKYYHQGYATLTKASKPNMS